MISLTVIRGFSELYGSWKIIWNLRRLARSSAPCEFGDVLAV